MNFTYFVSNFVPIALALIFIWRHGGSLLKKAMPVLVILGVAGLINALAEGPARHWGIWYYNKPETMGITIFSVLFETYVYCILVPIAIGSAAIKFAERQDARKK